jgi:HlyD family secretion protein
VTPDAVILELSNPQVEQAAEDAVLELKAPEAELANLRAQLETDRVLQEATVATVARTTTRRGRKPR